MNQNPYAADLGDRDPLRSLRETPAKIQAITLSWTDEQFERSYAPGKWSARRILIHLAQTELALGVRVRYALSQDDYAAQSFNQDEWLAVDDGLDGRTAVEVYAALRRMNLLMWERLSDEQRDRTFAHPEYGRLSVRWVAAQMAGHDLHHLEHFQKISELR